jgi:DNA-binding HxlR family transcriptional regulator
MDSFGDRWSLLVIRDMMLWGKRRYSEFLASGEGISTNILADRLKQMQRLGLVEKFRDPSNGKTSVYLLTDKGLSLFPVLLEVIRWGLQHDEHSMVPDPIAAALLDDSQALATAVAEQIKSERLALQQH